jgi:hypothetical protein
MLVETKLENYFGGGFGIVVGLRELKKWVNSLICVGFFLFFINLG